MFVIATAGHVDHGKSTLVRALTRINPDRLREEQLREMTIDLGFAWMTLPGGMPVGMIDVPGHIDFIDNMLAGVGGIDAALLVIAADEGPMPQTLEHLAILDLLKVPRAVVALTKTDLAPDPDWPALVADDIRKLLAPTVLAGAPVIPVSARANIGLDALVAALSSVLGQAQPRRDLGQPRVPVDRVFSMPGFGTIATGTLVDGTLSIGDEIEVVTQRGEILPARVRGLQTHKQKLERAQAGSRVAVNLTGPDISVERVARGSVVAKPGLLRPTTLVDVNIEMVAARGRSLSLAHNAEVKVFSGAAQSVAKVWLLAATELSAGGAGWAQLQLSASMALAAGDRFILRQPSPSLTLGGGVVVDAHPVRRYRRRSGSADPSVLERLDSLSRGTPAQRLANALRATPFVDRAAAMAAAQVNAEEIDGALAALIEPGDLIVMRDVLGLTPDWRALVDRAAGLLGAFHASQTLALGMPRDTLRSRLGLDARVFNALLQVAVADAPRLVDDGDTVRLASHAVVFNPAQQRAVDSLLAQCQAQPYNTPSVKDARAAVGDPVYEVLIRTRRLVQCGPDVIFAAGAYDAALNSIRELIARDGQVTAAQVRDAFSTTRKYALGLLEHLDAIGVTKRVGDARVLKR